MKEYIIVIIVIIVEDISGAPSLMSSRQLQKALGIKWGGGGNMLNKVYTHLNNCSVIYNTIQTLHYNNPLCAFRFPGDGEDQL